MALFYVKGTLSEMSEIKSGVSQVSGKQWANMTILLEIPGYQGTTYKMLFNVSGDRINDVQEHKIGDKVEIGCSIYAREWNDKWYNTIDLINIKPLEQKPAQTAAPAPQNNMQPNDSLDPQEGDLPF